MKAIFLSVLIIVSSQAFSQKAPHAQPQPTSVVRAEYVVSSVILEHGKTVMNRQQTICIVPGAFTQFHHVGLLEQDSDCKVLQGAKVPGDFFKYSCSNGNRQLSGSLRKLSDDGFTSSYVSQSTDGSRSMGTVAVRAGDC